MTLFDYLVEHAKKENSNTALINDTEKITYKELWAILSENQKKIAEENIYKGDVIGIKFTDAYKFVIAFLSFGLYGCSVVPLLEGMNNQEELNIVKKADIKQVVSETTCFIKFKVSDVQKFSENIILSNASTPMLYHLTSGSTGEKKICVRTLDALTAEGEGYQQSFGLGSNDRILAVPPLWHSFTLGAGLCSALVSGATLILFDKFIPRKVIKDIEKFQATFLILVPTMARLIAKTEMKTEYNLQSLKWTLLGTGNIESEFSKLLRDRFNIKVSINYGSTETGGVISRIDQYPLESIGVPMKNVSLKIKSDEGEIVGKDEVGYLWIKSKSMMQAYLGEKQTLDKNGYFYTGDLAAADEYNNIYIKGREKRILKIGGKTINPLEIENVLMKHDLISDCFVWKMPESKREILQAWIVLNKEIKEAEIIRYCKEHLSIEKMPSKINICKLIPRNELGKIDFNRFQKQIQDERVGD